MKYLLFLSLLFSTTVNAQETTPPTSYSNQVVHHVFFWLKNPGNELDALKLKEGLRTLEGIEVVQQILLGSPASTMERDVVEISWDVSEMLFFLSSEDQDIYQEHPIHQAFVENYSHLWQKVVVYDMKVD